MGKIRLCCREPSSSKSRDESVVFPINRILLKQMSRYITALLLVLLLVSVLAHAQRRTRHAQWRVQRAHGDLMTRGDPIRIRDLPDCTHMGGRPSLQCSDIKTASYRLIIITKHPQIKSFPFYAERCNHGASLCYDAGRPNARGMKFNSAYLVLGLGFCDTHDKYGIGSQAPVRNCPLAELKWKCQPR